MAPAFYNAGTNEGLVRSSHGTKETSTDEITEVVEETEIKEARVIQWSPLQ